MKTIIVALVSTAAVMGAASAQNTQGGVQPPANEGVQRSKSPNTTGSDGAWLRAANPTDQTRRASDAQRHPTPRGDNPGSSYNGASD
jgi:hypothetical protein